MSSLENKKEDYPKFIKSLPDYKVELSKEELKQIDFSLNEIVDKFIKTKLKDKELSICKYIIEKQDEKIKLLEKENNLKDKRIKRQFNLLMKEDNLQKYVLENKEITIRDLENAKIKFFNLYKEDEVLTNE